MTEATAAPLVLLLNGDPDLRTIMQRGLEMWLPGWTIAVAAHGAAAFALIRHRPPTLILTDDNVPDMDGVEFARAIKRAAPEARMLLVSALVTPDLEQRARAAGVDAVLEKPFKLVVLEVAVRALVAGAARPESAAGDAQGVASARDATAEASAPTILIVDDNAHIRALLPTLVLQLMPMSTVVVVADGGAALNVLQTRPVQLVITDQHMPGIAGLGLIAAIKGMALSTHIVLMTFQPPPHWVAKALTKGADAVLAKPFQIAELQALLAALLAQ